MSDPSEDKMAYSESDPSIDFASMLSNPFNGVWEMIFESLPDMVALINLKNKIVKANKAMLSKLNIGDESVIGHSCFNLLHENGCLLSDCPHLRMMTDRKSHEVELFEPRFGKYLHILTNPIFDSKGNLLGSLHIARDISIEKESEAKLRKYNTELKELNHSKDKFFSIVAHDLRSPFQGMLGFTDLILSEIDILTKEEIKDYLQKVRDSSQSTYSLLENLLNWSRMQTGRMQYKQTEFSLYEMVATVISLLDSNAQSKKISLINAIHGKCMVNADQQMVYSILLNLTTNAIKFTHPGGKVTISARIQASDKSASANLLPDDAPYLEISVSDTGVGLSAESVKRLFNIDDHFTLMGTSNEQGAGLGLIIVKEMTEKHGGTLTVKSNEGSGSEFTFSIPSAEAGFSAKQQIQKQDKL